MNDEFYHLLAGLIDSFFWHGELLGSENLPQKGPAVFIGNHLGSLGPIGAATTIPLRLYPWIHDHMVDYEKAAAYLNMDFVERRLKLKPPVSLAVSKVLSKITVPMFHSMGCIPVYRVYENIEITWNKSLSCLCEGKFLLVFPEDESLGFNNIINMAPFQKSVFRLGELYYSKTKERLAFFPVAIHPSRRVQIGSPILYNPANLPQKERRRLKNTVEKAVVRMYLGLSETREANYIAHPLQ